jgi:menaquinone-dependent protoporphyrinogen oxidase
MAPWRDTLKIAERVLADLSQLGGSAELADAANALCLELEEGEYDGAIVCAPVHAGKHPASVVQSIRESRACLGRIPSALISVSLSAAVGEGDHLEDAQHYVDVLVEETGWTPARTYLAAGALKYTQYDFLKRFVMKLIAERRGGSTDTSRDWEYTDWSALDQFVAELDHMVERGRERTPETVGSHTARSDEA